MSADNLLRKLGPLPEIPIGTKVRIIVGTGAWYDNMLGTVVRPNNHRTAYYVSVPVPNRNYEPVTMWFRHHELEVIPE